MLQAVVKDYYYITYMFVHIYYIGIRHILFIEHIEVYPYTHYVFLYIINYGRRKMIFFLVGITVLFSRVLYIIPIHILRTT